MKLGVYRPKYEKDIDLLLIITEYDPEGNLITGTSLNINNLSDWGWRQDPAYISNCYQYIGPGDSVDYVFEHYPEYFI